MPKKIKSVGEVIKDENSFVKFRKVAEEYKIVESYKEVFPELTKISKAVKVERETLFLKVENSVWRSELNLKQKIMTEKINNYFGEKVIRTIRFIS